MLVICYHLKGSELLDGITLSKSEQWRKLPRFTWLSRCKKQAWAGFVGSSVGVKAKWAAFWKRSPPCLQGIRMPHCPWKCDRWGTFFKLYQIKSLTSFPQKGSSKASLWTPPSKSVWGDVGRIWSPYKIPSKMYEAAYKLHWIWLPWASLAFMLNISGKYEMEITFSIQAFSPKALSRCPHSHPSE